MTHPGLFTDFDVHLFKTGRHFHLHRKFGAQVGEYNGEKGMFFSVWAPNATSVSVIGFFNHWQNNTHPLQARWDDSGIWEGFVPNITKGEAYKYAMKTESGEYLEKADPYAFYAEPPPHTASVTWFSQYAWSDDAWMKKRKETAQQPKPYSIYEVHLGSWRRKVEEQNRSLTYAELVDTLVTYVKESGFTHVELMPVMEHPFYGSWGYQITGYFAPSSRFGTPDDFRYLVNQFHAADIGVILDWVPSHFPGDAHGLFRFDGTHLYEHDDPRKGFHPDWNSFIFNYDKPEVRSFLISNAFYWLEEFHADGLRVDAVASMLYLDYSRKENEWIPNYLGGHENLEAISFLKDFNLEVYSFFPDVVTIAEESTAWPGVSHPLYNNGLGFGQKWMMGWMHDTLNYFKRDTFYRKYHQGDITFSLIYAFTENFMLPLSHDEVVHGKGSLLSRMPGDDWQKMANLRAMYGYMFTHPGTRLLFMGSEFAQVQEWNHDRSLDWHLLEQPAHRGVYHVIQDLNALYKNERALYFYPFSGEGFEWIDHSDYQNSVLAYIRKDDEAEHTLLVVCHFMPDVIHSYKIGVPHAGEWTEILNTDNLRYGGSGIINTSDVSTRNEPYHGREQCIEITLPPLGVSVWKWKG